MGGCVGGGVTVWICVGGAVGLCVGSVVWVRVGVTMAGCVGLTEAAGVGVLVDELELQPAIAAPATAAAATITENILLLAIFFPPVGHESPRRNGRPSAQAAWARPGYGSGPRGHGPAGTLVMRTAGRMAWPGDVGEEMPFCE